MTTDTNELRRLVKAALAAPDGLSAEWMDRLGQFQEAADASVVSELLDRLEAAEKERDIYKAAYNEWIAKTEWAQQGVNEGTISAKYLGLHRADGIKAEIDTLRTELNEIRYGVAVAHDTIKALRAKIEAMERQEPYAFAVAFPESSRVELVHDLDEAYEDMTNEAHEVRKLYLAPGAQPAPNAVAYLDLGVGGYMDIGTDLTDEELDAIPKGRHMLGIVGTYGIDGYVPAQPAPSVPEGWLRAIDEALVAAHIGVANAHDTYEQAKAKLDNLIGFNVDIATDPAVNGGWKLMPVEPTKEIYECFAAYDGTSYSNPFDFDDFSVDYAFALAAAPEAKP